MGYIPKFGINPMYESSIEGKGHFGKPRRPL